MTSQLTFSASPSERKMVCLLFILLSIVSVGRVVSVPTGVVKRETMEVADDEGEANVSGENKKGKEPLAKETKEEYDDFEVISEEDRQLADQAVLKELLIYAGYTLLAVVGSLFTVVCFLLDPRACLVAFASGSPCCLIFPCYRNLLQYTDPAKLIKANVNIYVPGIYIEEGGRLKEYPPSPEEMDCLYDLVSEFMTVE